MSKLVPEWQKPSVCEAVFDQISEPLLLCDAQFRITGVNRSAEALLGMSSSAMLGRERGKVLRCTERGTASGLPASLDVGPSVTHRIVPFWQ